MSAEPTSGDTVEPGRLERPSMLRIAVALLVVASVRAGAYLLWAPGDSGPLPQPTTSAKHPHGAWLTHAWWGDEQWYADSSRKRSDYFGAANVAKLARRMRALGIGDWYVHACPAHVNGDLPEVDEAQARLLVRANEGGQVLAWVGGVLHQHVAPSNRAWRGRFVRSAAALVRRSGIAGIHLNIEPCPSFEPGYLELLDELRVALPSGARLSVVAYPPPSALHPFDDVHWNEAFYRQVSKRADDLVVMAYDTSMWLTKPYTYLVAKWTREALAWSSKPVRMGLPAYDDEGVGYHDPEVENLRAAFPGLARGLSTGAPSNYAGWAVYGEWTLSVEAEATIKRWHAHSK